MRTQYFPPLLAVTLIIAMSSCRSESPNTTETAQATMSSSHSDRVYYIERSADEFAGDLVFHLSFGEDVQNPIQKINPVNNLVTYPDLAPTHIGPFCIKHVRPIKKEAWDLEKLILEWIFEAEE